MKLGLKPNARRTRRNVAFATAFGLFALRWRWLAVVVVLAATEDNETYQQMNACHGTVEEVCGGPSWWRKQGQSSMQECS